MKNKEKKMLSLLNRLDELQDDFEPSVIDDLEKRRLLDLVFEKRRKCQRRQRQQWIAAVSAGCMLGGVVIVTPFGQQVYANVQERLSEIRYSLAQVLGKTGDYTPYAKIVGQTVSMGAQTVRLNEVVLDGNRLWINHLVQCTFSEQVERLQYCHLKDLTVDGRKVDRLPIYLQEHQNTPQIYEERLFIVGESKRITRIDADKDIYSMTFSMDFAESLPTNKPLDISYRLQEGDEVSSKKNAIFRFSVDAKELSKDTIRSGEGICFVSDGGNLFTVQGLEMNLISQRIFFKMEKHSEVGEEILPKYLVGVDQSGRQIVFERRGSRPIDGGFELRFDFAEQDHPMGEWQSEISGEAFYQTGESYRFRLYKMDEQTYLRPMSQEIRMTIER